MAVFILRVRVPSAPKRSTEIMIKGDTLEDALAGAQVEIFSQQREVELKEFKALPGRFWRHICYKRTKVKEVLLGEPIEKLPF